MREKASRADRGVATFVVEPLAARPALSSFLKFWAAHHVRGPALLSRVVELDAELARGTDPVAVHRLYCGLLAGAPAALVEDCGSHWIGSVLGASRIRRSLSEVIDRGRRGPVYLVSDLIDVVASCLVRELGLTGMVATRTVVDDGVLDGAVDGCVVVAGEKATAMRRFARQRGLDLSGSSAWGVSYADLPVLRAVGDPGLVGPDAMMRALAEAEGWPTAGDHLDGETRIVAGGPSARDTPEEADPGQGRRSGRLEHVSSLVPQTG